MHYWLICFALFYQLDLVLQLNFVSDNTILVFSKSNVNITIDKIHPINSLHISNEAKYIYCSNGKEEIRGASLFDFGTLQVSLSLVTVLILSRMPSQC